MKQIKLAAFDIDGTLVPRGQITIPQDTKDAIVNLKSQGIHVVVATGRSSYFIQDDVINTIQPEYYVTINGRVVVDSDMKAVYTEPLNLDETHIMIEAARKHNFGIGLKNLNSVDVYHQFEEFAELYLHGETDKINILMNHENDFLPNEAPFGVFMIGDEPTILQLKEQLVTSRLSYAYPNAYEAIDAKGGKADGIDYILKQFDIGWDEIITFGDANNDTHMLEKAAIGVAMGNSQQDAKDAADFVTKSVTDGGITHALMHYNLLK